MIAVFPARKAPSILPVPIQDRARQLRQAIARFERLLRDCTDDALAKTYRAEIAAARAMLDEIACN